MNSEISRYKLKEILNGWRVWVHVSFWVVHFVIRSFFSRYHTTDLGGSMLVEITELPIKIAIAYLSIYFILRFIRSYNLSAFLGGISISFTLALFLKRIHDWYITFPVRANGGEYQAVFWDLPDAVMQLIYIYPTVVAITAITFTIEWVYKEQQAKELQLENKQNELRYLKSKIQPHFLFNTLNNLYSLSLDNSEKTPDAILQVSDLLSFMLYKADKSLISLQDEIDLIYNLYALESLRTTKGVEFHFNKSMSDESLQIPPLLLFPLAENAFKYGIGDDEAVSEINFTLEANERMVKFSTINKIQNELKADNTEEKGFGINTLKKRLNILYPNQYELNYTEKAGYFYADLNFKLV